MIYFIPAWYQENKWCENEQCWYMKRSRSEFDDTVKQIQLFHRNKIHPYQIMLLGFSPNFRHFLHRQSVFHAPYWSCFDAIQQVRRKKATVFSFYNVNWPKGIEFVYTPFAVIALLNGTKYAQIEFGEDGNPIQIDMFENNVLIRRNQYDDRGFVASTIVYENGKEIYQDYLMENGVWKIRHYLDTNHVIVNSKYPEYSITYQDTEKNIPFAKPEYDSLDQVVHEVLMHYLSMTNKEDMFCVAMHDFHTSVLAKALNGRKTILSFFENRYNICYNPHLLGMLERSGYVITDSKANTEKIEKEVGKLIQNITDITPYDSRMDFGISQQLSVQKILVPVDGLSATSFGELIAVMAEYLSSNENVEIHLFTRTAQMDSVARIILTTKEILKELGYDEAMVADGTKNVSENQIDIEEETKVRFYIEQCVDELTVSVCMRQQRLVVDMRKKPDLYLQIAAISMGIPQVVIQKSQFVEHEGNGLIINSMQELIGALSFYLEGLVNWNSAMVYSYELGKQYTTQVLEDKWKEVIASFE